jgi:hypothetical protein
MVPPPTIIKASAFNSIPNPIFLNRVEVKRDKAVRNVINKNAFMFFSTF